MLPGNLNQGLSQSCISAISIVMPPSVCMNKAETTLRTKGGGASFYVLHVDPVEPIGTAPLLDPTIRNGSVRNVHLRLKSQTTNLKTQVASPAAAPSTLGGHDCRDTSLEENSGPSWTDLPEPSLVEKPESSGGRRGHSWPSKGVKITKSCNKYK